MQQGADIPEVGTDLGDRARRLFRVDADEGGGATLLVDVLITLGARQRQATASGGIEDAVDERHMHPPQQVWVIGAKTAMDHPHPSSGFCCLGRCSVGDDGDVLGSPLQPTPRVGAKVGVGREQPHRLRMQRLQQEGTHSPDEGRWVGVDPPGHAHRAEDARIRCCRQVPTGPRATVV